jgi:hypothetical protein
MLGNIILYSTGVAAIAIGAAAVITVTGNQPQTCVDRIVSGSPGAVTALRARVDKFREQAQSGPASLIISESDATSAAQGAVERFGLPAQGVRVHYCPDGIVEGVGTLDLGGQQVLAVGQVAVSAGPDGSIVMDVVKFELGGLADAPSLGGLAGSTIEQTIGERLGVPVDSVNISGTTAQILSSP